MFVDDSTVLAPRDVATVNRELVEYYTTAQAAEFFLVAILGGHQPIRPPGAPEDVALALARAEHDRLAASELFFVDADMCQLVAGSFESMPGFLPQPFDLPAEHGFCVFAHPIGAAVGEHTPAMDTARRMFGDDDGFLEQMQGIYTAGPPPQIRAVSWGTYPGFPHHPWPAGGVWMSFYSASGLGRMEHVDPDRVREARALLPPLLLDNECAFAWTPPGVSDRAYELEGTDVAQLGTLVWARVVLATFLTLRQTALTETAHIPTPRPERRRAARAGLPERDVRVLRLRPGVSRPDPDQNDPGRRYTTWRWAVRPHWRNQWYPSLGVHRPKLIAQYAKGPAGAPWKPGTKVHLVTPPGSGQP